MFRQASVLLVDDDLDVREVIATMLQELGHRVVAEAATIRDASAFAMIAEFDLAIRSRISCKDGSDRSCHRLRNALAPVAFSRTFGAAEADLDRKVERDNRRDYRSGSDRKLITM